MIDALIDKVEASCTIYKTEWEDADMPEYDPATGKWYDMETGLEIP